MRENDVPYIGMGYASSICWNMDESDANAMAKWNGPCFEWCTFINRSLIDLAVVASTHLPKAKHFIFKKIFWRFWKRWCWIIYEMCMRIVCVLMYVLLLCSLMNRSRIDLAVVSSTHLPKAKHFIFKHFLIWKLETLMLGYLWNVYGNCVCFDVCMYHCV